MTRPAAESIELYFDHATERSIREIWASVSSAGLPALHNDGPYARTPHVSLVVVRKPLTLVMAIDVIAETVREFVGMPISFGQARAFAPYKGRSVVYLPALLPLRASALLSSVLGTCAEVGLALPSHATAERWVPHCTISRRTRTTDLDQAFELINGAALPAVSSVRTVIHAPGGGGPVRYLV